MIVPFNWFHPSREPFRIVAFVLIAFGLGTCLDSISAYAARVTDRIVAIVNNTVLTQSELNEEVQKEEKQIREKYQGVELTSFMRQLQFKALTRLIERTLQIQIAKQRGHEVTDAELNLAMRQFQQQGDSINSDDPKVVRTIKQQLTILKMIEREVQAGIMVSEPELKVYYETHLDRFKLPDEYDLSQILIRPRTYESPAETKRRAMDVYTALQQGADFTDLAERRSDGSEAVRGGHIGLVRKGELEEPLQKTLEKLAPGSTSNPIETEHGYHILHLNERAPTAYHSYSDVKSDIQAYVARQKSEEKYHRWIYELQNKAHIEVKF